MFTLGPLVPFAQITASPRYLPAEPVVIFVFFADNRFACLALCFSAVFSAGRTSARGTDSYVSPRGPACYHRRRESWRDRELPRARASRTRKLANSE